VGARGGLEEGGRALLGEAIEEAAEERALADAGAAVEEEGDGGAGARGEEGVVEGGEGELAIEEGGARFPRGERGARRGSGEGEGAEDGAAGGAALGRGVQEVDGEIGEVVRESGGEEARVGGMERGEPVDAVLRRLAMRGPRAEGLVEQGAEGVPVGSGRGALIEGELGGAVRGPGIERRGIAMPATRREERARARGGEELHAALRVEEHGVGAEVEVERAARVERGEGSGELREERAEAIAIGRRGLGAALREVFEQGRVERALDARRRRGLGRWRRAQSSLTRWLIVVHAAWACEGSSLKSGAPYLPSTRTMRNLLAAASTLKVGSEWMV
jgi:hypothetical protein